MVLHEPYSLPLFTAKPVRLSDNTISKSAPSHQSEGATGTLRYRGNPGIMPGGMPGGPPLSSPGLRGCATICARSLSSGSSNFAGIT